MATVEEFLKTDISFKSDFINTASGDLDIIAGIDNVKEALFRRLLTTPGTIIHRPNYGVNIKKYQNALNNIDTQRQLALSIQEQFTQDERVESVNGVSVKFNDRTPDTVEILVRVTVVGYGETTFGFIPFGDV